MSSAQPPPSEGKSPAVNALGFLGALFWSIQLLPQLSLNYRRKDTTGLQPSMMLLWACAGLPLGAHNILGRQNVALQVQAQILTSLSLLTWGQVMYYGHRWSRTRTMLVLAGLFALFGGIEVAIVCGFKYGLPTSPTSPAPLPLLLTLAILSAMLLSLGVLRHYYDAWTHRSVRGISWAFVLLDAAGDLTSLLSVLLDSAVPEAGSGKAVVDAERWAAAAIYGSELALWTGLMILGLLWNGRTWIGEMRRKRRERGVDLTRLHQSSRTSTRGGPPTADEIAVPSVHAEHIDPQDPESTSSPPELGRAVRPSSMRDSIASALSTSSSSASARSVFRTSAADTSQRGGNGVGLVVERLRMRTRGARTTRVEHTG